jgi:hypothetical protein
MLSTFGGGWSKGEAIKLGTRDPEGSGVDAFINVSGELREVSTEAVGTTWNSFITVARIGPSRFRVHNLGSDAIDSHRLIEAECRVFAAFRPLERAWKNASHISTASRVGWRYGSVGSTASDAKYLEPELGMAEIRIRYGRER